MRFRLRTLLIVLALGPPLLAAGWWAYDTFRPRSLEERMQKVLGEWEAMERRWYEAGGPSLDEEPVIGYPFGPNDPRYPVGFPPNGQRPSQRSKISND